MRIASLITLATLFFAALPSGAHHSVLHYDGKTEVKITGVVTRARFGFPHSVYRLDVAGEDGAIEKWILSTEDPRDAERLGFADEIKAIQRGDTITVVGWPHRFREREIRGHQLHYPDGRVVTMRRGNYIWPRDILRLDRLVMNPENIADSIQSAESGLPPANQVALWIAEADHIARAAFEVSEERPRLIGLRSGGSVVFPGVGELLACHTERADFVMTVDLDGAPSDVAAALDNGADYISEYNRVLSRWWEQERASCE